MEKRTTDLLMKQGIVGENDHDKDNHLVIDLDQGQDRLTQTETIRVLIQRNQAGVLNHSIQVLVTP